MSLLLAKPRVHQRKPTTDTPKPPVLLLSPRTVAYTHAILRSALNDALRDEVPGVRHVAELVSPPPATPTAARPLQVEALSAVITAIEAHRWRALWLAFLGLGLRKGEALGLLWSDLDLDNGLVTIRRSLRRRDGQLVDGPVNTQASGATLPSPRRW